MVYFYKVSQPNGELIGFARSADLRYIKNNKILCCLESLAQYVCVNEILYRVGWLNPENEDDKGFYPLALMEPISKEEYEKGISVEK